MKNDAAGIAATASLCAAILFVMACGKKLEGKYGADEAQFELEFTSRNKANFEYVMMPKVEVDYEVSGKTVKIKTSQFGTMVGTIDDHGCLAFGGVYGTLCRQDSNAPDFASRRQALRAMKSDLINMATAQEYYFSYNDGHYAKSMSALQYEVTPGVTITVDNASANGWSATATHASASKKCVVNVGTGASTDGEPICK